MILLKATNESLQLTNTSSLATPTIKNYAANYVGNTGSNTTTLSIGPDASISVGDWIIMVVTFTTTTTVTTPTGWTVLQPATTAGTLITAVYAKNYTAGDTTYTITTSANANTGSMHIMWGSGADQISNWVIGSNTLRANITPATTYNNVAASLTTTTVNNLVFSISTERTTANESGFVSMTGATPYVYLAQTAYDIQTTSIGIINQTTAGATSTVTIVYPNTQASNGQAIQIALPPAIANLDYSISYTEDTATTSQMSSNEGKITALATSTILSAPTSSSVERVIKLLTVTNINPYVGATLVLNKNIGGTVYNLFPAITLLAGEMIQYMDSVGWRYYAANGTRKVDMTNNYSGSNQVLLNDQGTMSGATGSQWLAHSNIIQRSWEDIATSYDGLKLATTDASYGYIYTSNNGGNTWTANMNQGLQQNWYGIYSSADGTKLVTSSGGQFVYISLDSGATFNIASTLPSYYYYGIGGSLNFQKIVVAANQSYLYTTINNGTTWQQNTSLGTGDWCTVCISGDSTKLYVMNFEGGFYASFDNGQTWGVQSSFSTSSSFELACSYDGTKVYACGSTNGYVYMSTNFGQTFTQITSLGAQNWANISCSSDGTKIVAAVTNGYIYTSNNSGVTWTQQTGLTSQNWTGVTMTPDGTKLFGSVSSGVLTVIKSYGNFTWLRSSSTLTLPSGGIIQLGTNTVDQPTPSASTLGIYSRNFASRPLLTLRSPAGDVTGLQHSIWQNSIVLWTPGINVGTWLGTGGATTGTAAIVTPTTTNLYTMMRRSTFSNVVTTTNQQLGITSDGQFLMGNNGSAGGFYFVCRFGFDAIATSCRAFVGLSSTTVIVSADPSTVLNIVGFGFDAADTAWTFYHNGASGTATKETIAGQGTLATANTGYDAYIWSPPNSSTVYYRLDRTDTGATLVDSSVNTNLPVVGTFLFAAAQMSNGTANTAVNTAVIGINRLYVETNR